MEKEYGSVKIRPSAAPAQKRDSDPACVLHAEVSGRYPKDFAIPRFSFAAVQAMSCMSRKVLTSVAFRWVRSQ